MVPHMHDVGLHRPPTVRRCLACRWELKYIVLACGLVSRFPGWGVLARERLICHCDRKSGILSIWGFSYMGQILEASCFPRMFGELCASEGSTFFRWRSTIKQSMHHVDGFHHRE